MEAAIRKADAGQGSRNGRRQGTSPHRNEHRLRRAAWQSVGQEDTSVAQPGRVETAGVHFSAHAAARMAKRGIDLAESDIARLSRAVDEMQAKGVRDALIYINHAVALIVSVKNRTVITAVDDASARENIFTNIDSAAIL